MSRFERIEVRGLPFNPFDLGKGDARGIATDTTLDLLVHQAQGVVDDVDFSKCELVPGDMEMMQE